MAQACLTQYFTPKRSKRSSTILANGDSIKSQKRKLKVEDENNENICSISTNSNKKRRISPTKPTDGYLQGCDLDQIDKLPLTRKNKIPNDETEKKIKTFERQKDLLSKITDINDLRKRLTDVRTHIDEIKQQQQTKVPISSSLTPLPAHQRFAHLLEEKPSVGNETSTTPIKKIASPADLRREVQTTETERLKKVLSKVDQSFVESLPTTPSKRITGINNRLLEQIRLKEESRTQLISLENTGLIKNEQERVKIYEIFQRMKESIDIIDQLFTTERQVALEYDKISHKILELHSARFNHEQVNENLDFIIKSMDECASGCIVKMKLRNKQYIKINRAKLSMDQLNEYIEKKLIEYKE